MGMIKEFKEFAMKGNVLDMAVGIIIGGAFGTVVKSMVDDVLMPPIGKAVGNLDFDALMVPLAETDVTSYAAAKEAGVPAIGYGSFLTNAISFLIVAFCVFLLIKAVNKARAAIESEPEPEKPEEPSEDVLLLREIRDSLKKG